MQSRTNTPCHTILDIRTNACEKKTKIIVSANLLVRTHARTHGECTVWKILTFSRLAWYFNRRSVACVSPWIVEQTMAWFFFTLERNFLLFNPNGWEQQEECWKALSQTRKSSAHHILINKEFCWDFVSSACAHESKKWTAKIIIIVEMMQEHAPTM